MHFLKCITFDSTAHYSFQSVERYMLCINKDKCECGRVSVMGASSQ